jgi:gamma-glutamyl hercynylcysteine S-oxide hydrolase
MTAARRLGALAVRAGLAAPAPGPRRGQADGFGVGWYVDGDLVPARHRRAGPMWMDETFADLARVIHSTAVLAAVRSATVGMPGGQAAPAPPRGGRFLFSHNGSLDD